MEIIRAPRMMQDTGRTALMKGRPLGLVPTMGALHEGHMSLVRTSLGENELTAVSIFVNPIQFDRSDDFERYPRELDRDISLLREAGVDILFMPEPGAIYPQGFATTVTVGGVSGGLCGAHRPGHFDGVATVVLKLFNIVQPRRAYFGLKDYQQCMVIKRLVADMNAPVELVLCPTRREPDGLAMSSRNQRLGAEDRRNAPAIHAALLRASGRMKAGDAPDDVGQALSLELEAIPGVTGVDYVGAYDPGTLEPLSAFSGRALIATAVRMGGVRLIDNVLV